uniref:PH domain-containing protein n=1 Tax=Ditylenchus dipsaci TaxID=166011 RepID=A0A915CP34_9BILA
MQVFPSASSTPNSVTGPNTPARPLNSIIKQGYMYMQEKRALVEMSKYFRGTGQILLHLFKRNSHFYMIPVSSSTKSEMKEKQLLDSSVSFKLKSCVRRASDSIDKRFCFDVIPEESTGTRTGPDVMTLQALSEEDRRQWLDSMDGREPVYSPGAGAPSANSFETMLDESGFDFVRQCLRVIEEHGIREQAFTATVESHPKFRN